MLMLQIFRLSSDTPTSLLAVGQHMHVQTAHRRSHDMVWPQGHLWLHPLLPY